MGLNRACNSQPHTRLRRRCHMAFWDSHVCLADELVISTTDQVAKITCYCKVRHRIGLVLSLQLEKRKDEEIPCCSGLAERRDLLP